MFFSTKNFFSKGPPFGYFPKKFKILEIECWKTKNEPISKILNFLGKYPKGGPLEFFFFSFLFNAVFFYGISKKTIRMPFRGLTMLKKHNINHKRRFVLRIRHGELSLCGSCFEMFLQFLQFQDHTVYRISRIYCLLMKNSISNKRTATA